MASSTVAPPCLADLLDALPGGGHLHAPGLPDADATTVTDVTHDSGQVSQGVLFACKLGQRADGHDFAAAAVAAGASALLVERRLPLEVPQLVTRSVAEALGPVAAAVHGRPSDELLLLGVTGTAGKTTTTYLLEAVLRAAGHVTGLIGTVSTLIAGREVPGVRTTPEATDLQRLLRRMLDDGVTAAAMEVSSHGLALGRVAGTRYRVAAFTNLGHDHLDFHADMEDYFAAKAGLFSPEFCDRAVVNVDDPHGARLAGSATVPLLRVSTRGRPADARAADVRLGPAGSSFRARIGAADVAVRVQLPGAFNVANALLALATAHAAGIEMEAAVSGIAGLTGVAGRMERVEAGQPFTVLVDYAHKPEALDGVLQSARELAGGEPSNGGAGGGGGKVVVVVGCGGDRDAGKRPIMGRVAATRADLAVLTSDNPRSEDPITILEAMREGAAGVDGANWSVEPDRRAGIAAALAAAGPGDVVVIAGKGHETYQELADGAVPFDDREVARRLLTEVSA